MTNVDLLFCLFAHLPPGFIEVRVIEDRKCGQVIGRYWYRAAQELVGAMAGLNDLAKNRTAGVFMGVLPRKAFGQGTAGDALLGLACWVDLDFRKLGGGEAEARTWLLAFPLSPSAIVRSGHGLHGYWFMREPTDPSVLSALSKGLARALGADACHDVARVLRVPGTWNRKDPATPVPVEVEFLDPSRAYNRSDFEDHLGPIEYDDESETPPDPIPLNETLSPAVAAILTCYPKVRGYFHGTGKPLRSPGGYKVDTTSSGYDFSLVLALVSKGITDERELATALWFRPDGQAQRKGERYIARTVHRSLDLASANRRQANHKEETPMDLNVDSIRLYDSDPPQCELIIEGRSIFLTSKELLSARAVRQRLFNVLHRVPTLPKQKDWDEKVNELMGRAEIVKQPPEASTDEFLRDQIRTVVADLREGDAAADLDRGMGLQHNGSLVFKTAAIYKALRESYREVSASEICSQLRSMGFRWITPRLDDKTVRVWTGSVDTANGGEADT